MLTETKNLFVVTTIILTLFIIEGLIASVCLIAEDIINGYPYPLIDWRHIFALIWYRVLMCTIPQVILYYYVGKRLLDKGLLKFSIFNASVLIPITILVFVILGISSFELKYMLQALPKSTFIYYFIIAAFFSPLILSKLPILKNLLVIWLKIG